MKALFCLLLGLLGCAPAFAQPTPTPGPSPSMTWHDFSLSGAIDPVNGIVQICDGQYHMTPVKIPHGAKIIKAHIDGGISATSGDFYILTPGTPADPGGVRLCDVHAPLKTTPGWENSTVRCDQSTWPLYETSDTDTVYFTGLCAKAAPGQPNTMVYFNAGISYQ